MQENAIPPRSNPKEINDELHRKPEKTKRSHIMYNSQSASILHVINSGACS